VRGRRQRVGAQQRDRLFHRGAFGRDLFQEVVLEFRLVGIVGRVDFRDVGVGDGQSFFVYALRRRVTVPLNSTNSCWVEAVSSLARLAAKNCQVFTGSGGSAQIPDPSDRR